MIRDFPRIRIRSFALRQLRLTRMMSQRELADKAKVNFTTISKYESGDRGGTPRTVRALARALRCDPLDIAEVIVEEAEAS